MCRKVLCLESKIEYIKITIFLVKMLQNQVRQKMLTAIRLVSLRKVLMILMTLKFLICLKRNRKKYMKRMRKRICLAVDSADINVKRKLLSRSTWSLNIQNIRADSASLVQCFGKLVVCTSWKLSSVFLVGYFDGGEN